jgi:hypothetical protein
MDQPSATDEPSSGASLRAGGIYLTFSHDPDTPFKFAKILTIEGDSLWLKV